MTDLETPVGELSPKVAWSRRVRRVGGFIQLAFAALWLVRGSLNVHKPAGIALAGAFSVVVLAVLAYGIRFTAGTGTRPPGQEAKRIERSVTIATVIELVAAFVLPVIVIAAGHAAPVEPDECSVTVLGQRRVFDPFTSGRVEEGSEAGHGASA